MQRNINTVIRYSDDENLTFPVIYNRAFEHMFGHYREVNKHKPHPKFHEVVQQVYDEGFRAGVVHQKNAARECFAPRRRSLAEQAIEMSLNER